jgi:hypothetical protein
MFYSTMEAQLAALTANIGQLCGKIDNLEKSLHELRVENTVVREELAAARKDIIKRDETIAKLTEQVNRLDQDARASSLRIVGLPIDAATPRQRFLKSFSERLSSLSWPVRRLLETCPLPPTLFCNTPSTRPSPSHPRRVTPIQLSSNLPASTPGPSSSNTRRLHSPLTEI